MKSIQNVYPILKYIDEHLGEVLTIKMIANVAGYSEYYFIRMFKDYMDITVMEYVCKRRLIKASEDILSGEKIIDVALKYGWKSHGGFTKAFKKEFDVYPSLLRTMRVTVENLGDGYMKHAFLELTKVGTTKEELFIILQEKLKINGINVNQQKLNSVYYIACNAYENVKRYSGEEYITHLINVSIILTELGATEDVILAGMFCDVNKKGRVLIDELRNDLPGEIYDIIINVQHTDSELALATEEVLLIRLAERLHNMRTIEFIDENKKQLKAKETIELFMPFAKKLGNKKLMAELNDLSIKYCNW